MLKHVLVPLDGSMLSEMALKYAEDVVCSGGKVTLLSIIELPIDYDYTLVDIPLTVVTARAYDETEFDNAYKRVHDYLASKARELNEKGLDTECLVESGDPATTIADVAMRDNVNAIVMTTHGRTGISRWLFGSVTQKVISTMPCPVLVVPGKVREKEEAPEVAAAPINTTKRASATS